VDNVAAGAPREELLRNYAALWADGTRPGRSNIYFKNVPYPRYGGTALQIDNGTGEFTLPKGFEYDAVASVENYHMHVVR
jgi:hypothetical protein